MTVLDVGSAGLAELKVETTRARRRAAVVNYLRTSGPGLAAEVGINFILPYLIFGWAKPAWGEVGALIASSAPPTLWSIVEFVRRRRVDALSILVLAGIVLSLLAYFGGGGVRMLQLREKLVTGAIGLIFVGSAVIGRPLIYQLIVATLTRRGSDQLDRFRQLKDDAGFKRTMTVMTLVWGFGLCAEAAVAGALVFTMSVQRFLIVGPVVGNGTMGALSLWSFWYGRRQRRRGDARRAAEAMAKGE